MILSRESDVLSASIVIQRGHLMCGAFRLSFSAVTCCVERVSDVLTLLVVIQRGHLELLSVSVVIRRGHLTCLALQLLYMYSCLYRAGVAAACVAWVQ